MMYEKYLKESMLKKDSTNKSSKSMFKKLMELIASVYGDRVNYTDDMNF